MKAESTIKRNWLEDANLGDDISECLCSVCGHGFTGHKRRVVCLECAQLEPQLNRDTDEESHQARCFGAFCRHSKLQPDDYGTLASYTAAFSKGWADAKDYFHRHEPECELYAVRCALNAANVSNTACGGDGDAEVEIYEGQRVRVLVRERDELKRGVNNMTKHLAAVEAERDALKSELIGAERAIAETMATLGDIEIMLTEAEAERDELRGVEQHYREVVEAITEVPDERHLSLKDGLRNLANGGVKHPMEWAGACYARITETLARYEAERK